MSAWHTAREEVARKVGQELADEARAEVLREAAEKIRNAPGWADGEWMDSRDRSHAADLIDPDKDTL